MAIWSTNRNNQHSKRPEEDVEEEDMRTFEEIVEDQLKEITKAIGKLDKRIEAIEKEHDTRIKELNNDLREKGEYIQRLLEKLLDQHVAVPLAKAVEVKPNTAPTQNKAPTPPVNGQGQPREKLAGPKAGAKLP